MFRSEFDGSAFDSACLSAHDGVKVCAIVLDGSEDFITCSRLDGGCPCYFRVGFSVVGLSGRGGWDEWYERLELKKFFDVQDHGNGRRQLSGTSFIIQ